MSAKHLESGLAQNGTEPGAGCRVHSRSRCTIQVRCSTRRRVTLGGSAAPRPGPATRRCSTMSESYTRCSIASLTAMYPSRHARWSAIDALRQRGLEPAPDADVAAARATPVDGAAVGGLNGSSSFCPARPGVESRLLTAPRMRMLSAAIAVGAFGVLDVSDRRDRAAAV